MPVIQGASEQQSYQTTLKDICIRISCGVATGADDVFVVDRKDLKSELAKFARPTIAGRELTVPDEISQAKCSMLIPYGKDGTLLDERGLEALGVYLCQAPIRRRLLERTCVRRKPWYAFHETPPLREILRPKILCKDITENPHFWIDRKGTLVPRHSVYYIVPEDPAIIDRLCDHLNSSNVALWLSEHCQRAANSFLRLQSSILKAIPVPDELRTPAASRRSPRHLALSPGPAAQPSSL